MEIKMNLIRSYSHPELLVGENGEIYRAENGERINLIMNHGLSTQGPVVCYRHNKKTKQLSVLNLVYECHVKKAKIDKGEYYDVIDDDYSNVKASNIQKVEYRFKKTKKAVKKDGEPSYNCYLNGNDEIFC